MYQAVHTLFIFKCKADATKISAGPAFFHVQHIKDSFHNVDMMISLCHHQTHEIMMTSQIAAVFQVSFAFSNQWSC